MFIFCIQKLLLLNIKHIFIYLFMFYDEWTMKTKRKTIINKKKTHSTYNLINQTKKELKFTNKVKKNQN